MKNRYKTDTGRRLKSIQDKFFDLWGYERPYEFSKIEIVHNIKRIRQYYLLLLRVGHSITDTVKIMNKRFPEFIATVKKNNEIHIRMRK